MDRRIQPNNRRYLFLFPLLAIGLALGVYFGLGQSFGNTLAVDADRLTIRSVVDDRFYEYITLTGTIEPREVYYLDSKLAGNVQRVYAEAGQLVERGDTLLQLGNTDLRLSVMQRESQLIEELNSQRQTELLLNQNDFNRRALLTEVEYQLALQRKQFVRNDGLFREGIVAASDYEPIAERYQYLLQRHDLLQEAYRTDSLARRRQLGQLQLAERRILDNLVAVQQILDRLYVLAETDGRLSDFTVRAGEAVTSGQRLGEIYNLDHPKIVAEVDEFYVDKVFRGQPGIAIDGQDSLRLTVEKIFPTVEEGRFRIEIVIDDPRRNFVRGQSFRLRLLFGQPSLSTLLASGNFYNSTGGHWVYRVEGDRAIKTPIELGRKNPNYYEVISGLEPGDRVITSDYDSFGDYEVIKFNP